MLRRGQSARGYRNAADSCADQGSATTNPMPPLNLSSGREFQPTIAHAHGEEGTPEPVLCGCDPGHTERTGRLRVRVVERQILGCFTPPLSGDGNEWGAAGARGNVKSGGHGHDLDCPALGAGEMIDVSFIAVGLESRPAHGCLPPLIPESATCMPG